MNLLQYGHWKTNNLDMKKLRNERRCSENEVWQRDRTLAIGSVKPAIATLNLSDYCAESEEETKEESKVTKDSRISFAATSELKYVS